MGATRMNLNTMRKCIVNITYHRKFELDFVGNTWVKFGYNEKMHWIVTQNRGLELDFVDAIQTES